MRRLIVLFVMLAFAGGVAMAESAFIDRGGKCGMPGADADGNLIFGGFGEVTLVLENGNKVMLKCHATGLTNDSGRAQSFENFPCGVDVPSDGKAVGVRASDSHATVSANGNGTMTCVIWKP